MKMKVFAVFLFLTGAARAETTYRWVPLTDKQASAVDEAYRAYASTHVVSAPMGGVATTGVVKGGISFFRVGSLVPASISSGAVLSAIAAEGYALFRYYFSPQELYWLTIEKQSHSEGLVSAKFEQVTQENGLDANRMLAALNILAIQNQICGDLIVDQKSPALQKSGEAPVELKPEMTLKDGLAEQFEKIRNQLIVYRLRIFKGLR